MINLIYSRLLYPMYKPESYGGLARRWKELRAAERGSLAENQARQWTDVQRMVKHAYETTAFYRQRLDEAGIAPSAIRNSDDLRHIPPLTRDDIRGRQEALISKNHPSETLYKAATGGTTDSPVPLFRDRACLQTRNADQLRFDTWSGASLASKKFWLWGASMDFAKDPSWRWRIWERQILRQVWAPTSELNDEICERYRQQLNDFKPKTIIAYPTPLTIFCDYLLRIGRQYHRPEGIVVTAEPLSSQQRQTITETFGVEPFLQYGSRDFGMIASECERHSGLHYNPLAVYLEFVPVSDGLSEILVTDLTNRAMPMLRYKIGDCALPIDGTCECGRGYPRMTEVIGRTVDNFDLGNGTVVPGVSLTNRVLKDFSVLKKVQIVQRDYADFLVRFVPGPDFREQQLESVANSIRAFIGRAPSIAFEQVADIGRERSGKTRLCISLVKPREHDAAAKAEQVSGGCA